MVITGDCSLFIIYVCESPQVIGSNPVRENAYLLKRFGEEESHLAHNQGITGSKPVVAIRVWFFTSKKRIWWVENVLFALMAQW